MRLRRNGMTNYGFTAPRRKTMNGRASNNAGGLMTKLGKRFCRSPVTFPGLWSDPSVEPRERKRMLRLLIEDVTLLKADVITAQVRLRGGATRTLVLPKPVPIAQIRKVKPAIVAEIDR